MASKKLHYRASKYAGVCGYYGDTTQDKTKVTCKICKKMIKSGKYLE